MTGCAVQIRPLEEERILLGSMIFSNGAGALLQNQLRHKASKNQLRHKASGCMEGEAPGDTSTCLRVSRARKHMSHFLSRQERAGRRGQGGARLVLLASVLHRRSVFLLSHHPASRVGLQGVGARGPRIRSPQASATLSCHPLRGSACRLSGYTSVPFCRSLLTPQ